MNKKGVELSMNLIIIAAIGLLVLVILAVLVINSTNKTNTSMQSCNLMGGVCKSSCVGEETITNAAPCTAIGRTQCCKIISVQTQ